MEGLSHKDQCRYEIAAAIWRELQAGLASGDKDAIKLAEVYGAIEKPKDESMGDYALPAFRFAKTLKKNPAEVASGLAARLNEGASPWIDKARAVGPFLNFHVNPGHLAQNLLPRIEDGSYFKALKAAQTAERVMIEYSQPNTHKVFHVGHMRNVALGDSLWRLYEYVGHEVIPVNYIGDEGTHIAKCLWYISCFRDEKELDQVKPEARGEWLGEMYTLATFKLEDASETERKEYEKAISEVLRGIESKKGKYFDLWQKTRDWSIADFNDIYQWLGARFDHYFYESEVSEASQGIVEEYLKKGVFVEDQGAVGVDLKDYKLGFAIFRKRDGNTLYATKDLALARRKFTDFNIQKSIYVVGSEQNLHFRQVFKTLELMGFPQAKDCYHLSYGLVVLPEGKMSSRKGNIIPFSKLKSSMTAELNKHLDKYRGEWSDEEIAATSKKLAVGAIRYGMVCSDPTKEIVFNLTDWLSFEGNTGPYLMYSYARARSIVRKGEESGIKPESAAADLLTTSEEHDLLLAMYAVNEYAEQACSANKPSVLAHHLFNMCKAFNRFHKNVSVLKAESPKLQAARLALVNDFARLLKQGLALLGITPPERM